MSNPIAMLEEFFGAVKEIAIKVPLFSEKQKKNIEKEFNKMNLIKARFEKAAIEFNIHSRSDELLGLADELDRKKEKFKQLIVIYAKELNS